jgi:CRISPR type IV-associated protein Csf3
MYKITFKIRAPYMVTYTDKPIFDALLAYCAAKEHVKNLAFKLSYSKEEIDFVNSKIPLKRDAYGNFVASIMLFDKENQVEQKINWTKHWDNAHDELADFGKKARKINVTSGEFKSYRVHITTHQHKEVFFYFDTEDVSQVEYLLKKHLPAIGKKRSSGYGEIECFNIEKIEHNPFETEILRPIPLKSIDNLSEFTKQYGNNYYSRYTAFRPPYHQSENFEDCFVPV